MLVAIVVHFAAALVLPAVARRWDRAAFAIGALVPASAFALALTHLGGLPVTEFVSWAPVVGLEFTVRLDALAMVMTALVSGIGAVVLVYYARYAEPGNPASGRDAATMVAFAGGMLGLVLADDVLSLYLFWEITTVCSFLLIGGGGLTAPERRSARQALLVTTLGGLSLLLGLILLSTAAGTLRLSEIIERAPSGPAVTAGIALLLVGVLTKSAQIPFHPWLPAAMVAPTPVSAYLHAAAMVKAGVYLVARFDPAFADRPQWWLPLVAIGIWTMLLGGLLAMRQHDLKLLLAYGTVSQLGFLLVLLAVGTRVAALAGLTMLLAHGLFKSALFLTVGAIDKHAGSRDLRELSGLGRRWPVLAVSAGLAAASMAGLPPLLGFVGKETAFEAFSHGSVKDLLILVGIVAGSLLTAAYTFRFFAGAFGTRAGAGPVTARAPGPVFTTAVALPAFASLLLGVWPWLTDSLAGAYAARFPGQDYHLALWHGWTVPLLLSAVVLLGGYLLYRAVRRREALWARASGWVPPALRAQQGYRATVRGLDELARLVTARLQTGSLPTYLGIILATVVVVPTIGLVSGIETPPAARGWSTLLQFPLALVVVAAALLLPAAQRRLTAVLLTGVVGYGVGGLFLIYGATDLALAQFLVETLTLVVFVLVLRRFEAPFVTARPRRRWVSWRKATLATFGGLFVAMFAVVFSGTREGGSRAGAEYIARAESEAGATNVVTAILVDFRAMDTIGEITVLLVAATGAASLGLLAGNARGHRMPSVENSVEGGVENRAEDGPDAQDGEVSR